MRKPTKNCAACHGEGARWYSSGATWRGGMGTAAFAWDQCDTCWGSGSSSHPWPNVRELEREHAEATDASVAEWISQRTGRLIGYKREANGWRELLAVVSSQTRRRKLPDGVDPFWYQRTVEILLVMLRRLAAARETSVEKGACNGVGAEEKA